MNWKTATCVAGIGFLATAAVTEIEQRLGPPTKLIIGTTNSGPPLVDLYKATNDARFEWQPPTPTKVTIWFQYQWNNGFEFSPASLGFITTNIWPVTASNATAMAKAFLNSNGSDWKFITLTGIWRDE